MVFRWEQSPDFGDGDAILIRQVCLQMGFPMDDTELPFYLSGKAGSWAIIIPRCSS